MGKLDAIDALLRRDLGAGIDGPVGVQRPAAASVSLEDRLAGRDLLRAFAAIVADARETDEVVGLQAAQVRQLRAELAAAQRQLETRPPAQAGADQAATSGQSSATGGGPYTVRGKPFFDGAGLLQRIVYSSPRQTVEARFVRDAAFNLYAIDVVPLDKPGLPK